MGFLSLLFSAMLLVAPLLFSPSSQVTDDTIFHICSQAQSEEFCQTTLKNDSRTHTADVPELLVISINITIKQATANYETISMLSNNATDPLLKQRLDSCWGMYARMLDELEQAYRLSMVKDYKDLGQIADAQKLATNCENGFTGNSSPTTAIGQTMILTCQTASCVLQYLLL